MPDVETIMLGAFITGHRLALDADRATSNPNALAVWADQAGARHWRCVIYRHGPAGPAARDASEGAGPIMETWFSQGSAHTTAPTIADVLDCLASDARSMEAWDGTGDDAWIDWADELGLLDPDGDGSAADRVRAARQTWDVIVRQSAQLALLLGPEAYRDLIERVEPL